MASVDLFISQKICAAFMEMLALSAKARYAYQSMIDKSRATVLLLPRTVEIIQRIKAELLQRNIDLNTGQIFRLAVYSLDPSRVTIESAMSVIEEDGRRTRPAESKAHPAPPLQKVGRHPRPSSTRK
jgi:hypothetical protein